MIPDSLPLEDAMFIEGVWDESRLVKFLDGELLNVHIDAVGLDSSHGKRQVNGLMYAAFSGNEAAVERLVTLGADLEAGARLAKGWTALHVACSLGHWDVVTRLVAAGAKMDFENKRRYAHSKLGCFLSRWSTVWDVAALSAQGGADGGDLSSALRVVCCAKAAIAALCELHHDSPGTALQLATLVAAATAKMSRSACGEAADRLGAISEEAQVRRCCCG